MMDIEDCATKGHWICEDGAAPFCMVCTFRTDQAFALWSRQLLQRIKTHALKETA